MKSRKEWKAWTDAEVDFLVENYLFLGAKECARQLGRSETAVWQKVMSPDVRRRVGYKRMPKDAVLSDGKLARDIYLARNVNPAVPAVAENPVRFCDILAALDDLEMIGITEDKLRDLTVDEIMQMRGMAVQMLEIMQK